MFISILFYLQLMYKLIGGLVDVTMRSWTCIFTYCLHLPLLVLTYSRMYIGVYVSELLYLYLMLYFLNKLFDFEKEKKWLSVTCVRSRVNCIWKLTYVGGAASTKSRAVRWDLPLKLMTSVIEFTLFIHFFNHTCSYALCHHNSFGSFVVSIYITR